MAVYTRLTQEEIARHLQNYNLGELVSFKEIIEGIDNSNFIIETTKGKFILTIFESRINKNDLPFFINFKLHLAKKGICCPAPVLDKSGEVIVDLAGKKSTIVSFLNGSQTKNILAKHCFEVGKNLAQLHVAAADFNAELTNNLGVKNFRQLFHKFVNLLDGYQKDLQQEILQNIDFIEKSWKEDLPSCAAHLDLFVDNVFFDNHDKVSGIIDFYFAANDLMIYDFAITVNAWCFDDKNNFSQDKFSEITQGYEVIRKFSAAEKDFLKIALVAAAMRFLLTRLHDMFFTPKDSLVKIKDPQEYLAKLRFFKAQI